MAHAEHTPEAYAPRRGRGNWWLAILGNLIVVGLLVRWRLGESLTSSESPLALVGLLSVVAILAVQGWAIVRFMQFKPGEDREVARRLFRWSVARAALAWMIGLGVGFLHIPTLFIFASLASLGSVLVLGMEWNRVMAGEE